MGYLTYKGYLETYHWQLLRNATFEYYGKRCYDCHISHWWSHLEVHHESYKNRGHERLEDVKPLCRNCHRKRHAR